MSADDIDSGAPRRFLAAVGRGAASIGRSVAAAYYAVDPDLRRHAAQLPLAGLSGLMPRPRPIAPLPDGGYRTLLLVHGLGGHPGNFVGLKTYLSGRGRTRVYVADFGDATSFDAMAQKLAEIIDAIVAVNELGPTDQIDIVAHSMGGLVARLALESPEVRARVANLVTLGTPHSGSHLARLAATDLVLGLRPGSEVMQRLEAQDFWGAPNAPLVTAVWSAGDTVVIPAEHARFDRGRNIELAGATHYSYLLRPTAWALTWEILQDSKG